MKVRKATKCLRFMSKQPDDRLHCRRSVEPKRRVPRAPRRCGNGGTTFSGLTHLVQVGAQALLSASPTANPVSAWKEMQTINQTSLRWALGLLAFFALFAGVAEPGAAESGAAAPAAD